MKKRIITASILVLILAPLVIIESKFTHVAYAIVSSLLCMFGAFEVINTMYKESKELRIYRYIVPLLSFIVSLLAIYATYKTSISNTEYVSGFIYHFYPLLASGISILIIFGLMIFTKDSDARAIMGCVLAIIYSGLLLGYAFSLRFFQAPILNGYKVFNVSGIKSFLYVYSIVISTDMFAYFFGRKLGKHKLCPDISPNKSVEGSIFGLIFGVVVGVGVALISKIVVLNSPKEWIIGTILLILFSGLVSIFDQIGDLIESKFKRSFNVKDFGFIFPGHGGVLDRFDSLLFTGSWYIFIIHIIQIILLGV